MDPIRLVIPEHQFLEELAEFILPRIELPRDGKWRHIKLEFELRSDNGPDIQTGGAFLLGGPSAG